MGLQIIPVVTQPKLHQFTQDELMIVRLGSNPSKFDQLIFRNLKSRRRKQKQ